MRRYILSVRSRTNNCNYIINDANADLGWCISDSIIIPCWTLYNVINKPPVNYSQ